MGCSRSESGVTSPRFQLPSRFSNATPIRVQNLFASDPSPRSTTVPVFRLSAASVAELRQRANDVAAALVAERMPVARMLFGEPDAELVAALIGAIVTSGNYERANRAWLTRPTHRAG